MKRPVSKKNGTGRGRGKRKRPRLSPEHGLVALPEAVGRTIDELIVANSSDDSGIDIFFEDQTGLSFSFEAGIKLRVAQVDAGRTGWREIKRWSRPKPV
jgi:hypothetical protein